MALTNQGGCADKVLRETESPGTKAVQVFRKPPHRLNCAQAVAHAWASDSRLPDVTMAELGHHGGGNAPEGECGALFAARQIALRRGADAESLRQRFAAVHGATTCHELRARRVACVECVRAAADLVK